MTSLVTTAMLKPYDEVKFGGEWLQVADITTYAGKYRVTLKAEGTNVNKYVEPTYVWSHRRMLSPTVQIPQLSLTKVAEALEPGDHIEWFGDTKVCGKVVDVRRDVVRWNDGHNARIMRIKISLDSTGVRIWKLAHPAVRIKLVQPEPKPRRETFANALYTGDKVYICGSLRTVSQVRPRIANLTDYKSARDTRFIEVWFIGDPKPWLFHADYKLEAEAK